MIHIEAIHISVNGLNEAEAEALGRQVVECMSARFNEHEFIGNSYVDEVMVRYAPAGDMGQLEMADQIAQKLLLQLNR